jgi:O-antigen ligase
MTLDPRPAPPSAVRTVRGEARRGARSLSGGLLPAIAIGLALFAVIALIVLDYGFDQDPHRLVKIIAAVALLLGIVARPKFGLLALPVLTPFLGWMPKLPIPGVNPLNILVFTVFIAFALVRVLQREPVFRRGRLDGWLFALVGLAAISVVRGAAFPTGFTYDGKEAATQVFRCSMTFTIYFIGLAMAREPGDRKAYGWAIVVGLVAESIATIVYGRSGRGGRAEGSIGQANDLGAFLALFTVLSMSLLAGVRRLWQKALLAGAVAVGSFAVLMTVSRGAIIALVVGIAYVVLRSSRWLTFVLLALLITSPLWTPDYVKDRVLGTQIEDEQFDDVTLESSSQLRVDTWRAIVEVVTEHPLDGVGFTGLGYVLPQTGSALGVAVKDSAHNTYLRLLAEMGLLGLFLFVGLLWQCWRLGRDGERAAIDPFDRQLAMGLRGATLVLALCCAFGDRFFPIVITGNFWLLCALVNARISERRESAA